MARVLFCRRCAAGYASTAGDVPRLCPFCGYGAGWTTQQMASVAAIEPLINYELTPKDRSFLSALKILAE